MCSPPPRALLLGSFVRLSVLRRICAPTAHMSGGGLRQLLGDTSAGGSSGKVLAEDTIVRLLRDIGKGLARMHGCKPAIIHRDLKARLQPSPSAPLAPSLPHHPAHFAGYAAWPNGAYRDAAHVSARECLRACATVCDTLFPRSRSRTSCSPARAAQSSATLAAPPLRRPTQPARPRQPMCCA